MALILFTTSIGAFLPPFTSSAISFAVPEIGTYFRASFYQVIWAPQSFLIALASMILILGRLSDSLGRIKFFRIGFLIYITGIIISLFSNTIVILAISLFISGTGSAILGANSTAIVSQVFEAKNRGRGLGINVMSVYLGLTLAPLLSGLLITISGWRTIFYFTIPVSLIGLLISFITLKNLEIRKNGEKLDLLGGLIFTSFIFSIVMVLSIGEIYGWITAIYPSILVVALFIIFILWENKVKEPLIDLHLFTQNRTFLASNLTALINYVSTFSIVFVFSMYLQVIDHFSAEYSGILLISEPLLMVIFSPLSGILSDRFGSREIAAIGMGLIGIAFIFLFIHRISTVYDIIVPLAVIGIGFGLFSAANTNSVMGSVGRQQYGTASGTLGTMRFTGQLISVAIAGTILASILPRRIILGMFTGVINASSVTLGNEFYDGFRMIMLLSGLISFVGVYTSLMKNRKK